MIVKLQRQMQQLQDTQMLQRCELGVVAIDPSRVTPVRGAQAFNLLSPQPILGDRCCNVIPTEAKKPTPTKIKKARKASDSSLAPNKRCPQKQKTSKVEWVKPIVGVKLHKGLPLYRVRWHLLG